MSGKVQIIESGGFQEDMSCADDPTSEGCDGYKELLDFKASYAP